MPAPFILSLCGYRNGRPNTSDAGDPGSISLGEALFSQLGVPPLTPEPLAVDALMTQALVNDVNAQKPGKAFEVGKDQHLDAFEQYAHLAAIRELAAADKTDKTLRTLEKVERAVARSNPKPRNAQTVAKALADHRTALESAAAQRRQFLEIVGKESLLKLDVTISTDTANGKHLDVGLSLKWTLRTDRAQDCRTQGANLSRLRRGRMPQFAAVTMEPRPAMLALLGRGSGDLDCVYHLDLPSLKKAVKAWAEDGKGRRQAFATFTSLVKQRRLRDYDDLIASF